MITRINNKEKEISEKIHLLFQASYKIEAELLKATNFPPLKRTVHDLIGSNNTFFAYYIEKEMLGAIEIDDGISMHIQSLVVHPKSFRKGIGKKLVSFVLDYYTSNFSKPINFT